MKENLDVDTNEFLTVQRSYYYRMKMQICIYEQWKATLTVYYHIKMKNSLSERYKSTPIMCRRT